MSRALIDAREKIADSKNYSKHILDNGTRKADHGATARETKWVIKEPNIFSFIGALSRCNPDVYDFGVLMDVARSRGFTFFADYENSKSTTHAELLVAVDEAIELKEKLYG